LGRQDVAIKRLLALLNERDPRRNKHQIEKAAIDAGPSVVPALREFVQRSGNKEQRLLGLEAASLIGGPEVIDLVRSEYKRGRDDLQRRLLARVLPSADTIENRRELIGMLGVTDDRWLIHDAALSLGVLRASEAVAALKRVSKSGGADYSGAKVALNWIQAGYRQVGPIPVGEDSRVIAAVLRNGSPNIDEKGIVIDSGAGGFWSFTSNKWVSTAGPTSPTVASASPSITGSIGVEGSLALVSVELVCGGLCGTGYRFVLRKSGIDWKIQMLNLDWIS
jgi:hypothetical protein